MRIQMDTNVVVGCRSHPVRDTVSLIPTLSIELTPSRAKPLLRRAAVQAFLACVLCHTSASTQIFPGSSIEHSMRPAGGVADTLVIRDYSTGNPDVLIGHLTKLTPEYAWVHVGEGVRLFTPDDMLHLHLASSATRQDSIVALRYWPLTRGASLPIGEADFPLIRRLPPQDTIYVYQPHKGAVSIIGQITSLEPQRLTFSKSGANYLYQRADIARIGLDTLMLAAVADEQGFTGVRQGWSEIVERYWEPGATVTRLVRSIPVVSGVMGALDTTSSQTAAFLSWLLLLFLLVGYVPLLLRWFLRRSYQRQLEIACLQKELIGASEPIVIPTAPLSLREWMISLTQEDSSWEPFTRKGGRWQGVTRVAFLPVFVILLCMSGLLSGTFTFEYVRILTSVPITYYFEEPVEALLAMGATTLIAITTMFFLYQSWTGGVSWWRDVGWPGLSAKLR